jgi:uncharacterized membrane protein
LLLASIAATAYSKEFTEILKPFVGGIIDTALIELAEEDVDAALETIESESENFVIAYSALRRIGLPESACISVAEKLTGDEEERDVPVVILSDMIADKLSSSLAFAFVFGVAFILLAIIFAVIGNLIGFVFSLPGLKFIDVMAGTACGIIKGLLIVFALAAVLRYAGILAAETIDGTSILKHIINNNFIANRLGI